MIALVVDDSAAMRRMQQKALEGLGWDVRVAANGIEALTALHEMGKCDLVLTDWHMPEMDGIEFVRRLREDDACKGIRVLMVTSEAVVESIDRALQAGVDDLVMKPFSAAALGERIAEVMGA